jgi:hypothetical protein
MAGYSQTSLIKKLGIKREMKLWLLHAPGNYYALLEQDVSDQLITDLSKADIVHMFVISRKELQEGFKKIIGHAKDGLIIWISWYKKSAGIVTDITEDVIREIVLPEGWVDIKVCAVSDVWSGLKIVKRKRSI